MAHWIMVQGCSRVARLRQPADSFRFSPARGLRGATSRLHGRQNQMFGGQQQNPHPTPANLLDQVLAGRVVPAVNGVLMALTGAILADSIQLKSVNVYEEVMAASLRPPTTRTTLVVSLRA